jgi:uncharacterized protein (TIGR03066 family)
VLRPLNDSPDLKENSMRRLVLLTGFVLLSLSGCSSNNTGKIVGTWELTGGRPPGAREIWEFTAAGKVSVQMSIGARNKSLTGTYSLGSGDTVQLHFTEAVGGSKHHAQSMQIKGDELTMSDLDGTKSTFKRAK